MPEKNNPVKQAQFQLRAPPFWPPVLSEIQNAHSGAEFNAVKRSLRLGKQNRLDFLRSKFARPGKQTDMQARGKGTHFRIALGNGSSKGVRAAGLTTTNRPPATKPISYPQEMSKLPTSC